MKFENSRIRIRICICATTGFSSFGIRMLEIMVSSLMEAKIISFIFIFMTVQHKFSFLESKKNMYQALYYV
jgi:hypothetical protein